MWLYLVQYFLGDGTFCAEVCDAKEVACKIGSGIFQGIMVWRLRQYEQPQKMWYSHEAKCRLVSLYDMHRNIVETAHYE